MKYTARLPPLVIPSIRNDISRIKLHNASVRTGSRMSVPTINQLLTTKPNQSSIFYYDSINKFLLQKQSIIQQRALNPLTHDSLFSSGAIKCTKYSAVFISELLLSMTLYIELTHIWYTDSSLALYKHNASATCSVSFVRKKTETYPIQIN